MGQPRFSVGDDAVTTRRLNGGTILMGEQVHIEQVVRGRETRYLVRRGAHEVTAYESDLRPNLAPATIARIEEAARRYGMNEPKITTIGRDYRVTDVKIVRK